LERSTKINFILAGFTQDQGCRVFAFEGIGADHTRTAFTVRADLAMSRRYGIRIQELPLLCRGLLDRRDGEDPSRTVVYTEAEMSANATERAVAREEAARKRKQQPRRPSAETLGEAWRAPHL
jgi:hypothetical protein